TITLIASNALGEEQTTSRVVTVYEHPEIATNASPILGVAPMRINLSGEILKGEIHSWTWDLGNGITRTGKNVSYVYTQPGTYIIRLTGNGPHGT
ncbi:MAG TPA: PKD domain-containing protein, partial [Aggregatilineales bacterium]|nr:PKD domain-containing protein [Aggregatilineales bacterium]